MTDKYLPPDISEYKQITHIDNVLDFIDQLDINQKSDSRVVDIRPLSAVLWKLVCLFDEGKIDAKRFRDAVLSVHFELATYTHSSMFWHLTPFKLISAESLKE